MTVPGVNTLAYAGIKEPNPPNLFFRERDPDTVNGSDYRIYDVGDLWQNLQTLDWWILTSKAQAFGLWVPLVGVGGNITNINNVTPVGGGITLVNTGAVNITAPLAPGQIGLGVKVDGVTVQIIGDQLVAPGGAGTVNSLTGDAGGAVAAVAGNINIQGGLNGIQFTNGGAGQLNAAVQVDGVTVTINGGGQLVATGGGTAPVLSWVDVPGVAQVMAPQTGYTAANAGTVTFTLPAVCPYGREMWIAGRVSPGSWTLAQGVGQSVDFGAFTTTVGVGGSITPITPRATIHLLCTVANTKFEVLDSTGAFTIV